MVKTRFFSILHARDAADLSGRERVLFYLWNGLILLLSSAVLAVLSLSLAYGTEAYPRSATVFRNYFIHFSLFLLNWLPIFLFQLLMYGLFRRQWLAYLLTSLLFLLASVGHYYKMKFRYEPFLFSDLSFIGAALEVAGDYDMMPGKRVLLVIAAIPAGTLLVWLLAKGRPGKKLRLGLSLAVLVSVFPLWRFVYISDAIYDDPSVLPPYIVPNWKQQVSMTKGFVYPFIHSILPPRVPENYDVAATAALLSSYSDAGIPADRQVNLLILQLEGFSDLETMGIPGISPEAYELYHALEAESCAGRLICNVNGGNTINTERCFLTSGYYLTDYSSRSYSNVRYLLSQGYTAVGSHPNTPNYYARAGVNKSLGFEDYWFLNTHYQGDREADGWYLDRDLFPEVLRQFRELTGQGKKVFSFNVTTQGHSPYESEAFLYDTLYWPGEGASDYARYVLNNYLGSVRETQEALLALVDELRDDPEPAVLLVYGDHKPWMGDNASVLQELGIDISPATQEGFLNYYSTRYLIWANDAAQEMLGDDLAGQGPDVSVCFLMNLLFDKLGWKGSAFNQFCEDIRRTLPVVTSNGYYYENGRLVTELSGQGQEAFRELEAVTYYVNKSYPFPQAGEAS